MCHALFFILLYTILYSETQISAAQIDIRPHERAASIVWTQPASCSGCVFCGRSHHVPYWVPRSLSMSDYIWQVVARGFANPRGILRMGFPQRIT